ncbi:MAG: AAA family ATPase, partial [Acidimicrobiia bacterium]|nr:AAA family ATPase [Acidimicrobiia bacterium]
SFDLECRRIQFTPDLLPSDVTGVSVFDRGANAFSFRPGPVFANVVIGDEINRASPKTQSALLEAMQERQVTIDATTHALPSPFLVIGTQNPIEHEGTYPLPESQLDRFLMRIRMGYPARRAEIAILDTHGGAVAPVDDLSPVASAADVGSMINLAQSVHVAPSLKGYIVDLAEATRRHGDLAVGVSPRAALGLQRAARARAAALGREYVVPDDLKELAFPVLEHRLALTPEAQMRGVARADVLADAVGSVKIPTGRSG